MRSFLKSVCAVRHLFAIAILSSVIVIGGAADSAAALIAYDGFDYGPAGNDLSGNNGGIGFASAWGGGGSLVPEVFDMVPGGLADPTGRLVTSGNHVTSPAIGSNKAIQRFLADPIGVSGTTKYLSFLLQPEGTVGGGGDNGTMGLILGQDAGFHRGALFIGKPGAAVHPYVIEHVGGAGKVSTDVIPVSGETVFMVLRIDFADGADSFSLFMNPVPGGTEPLVPDAFKTDLDVHLVTRIIPAGPGAFSIDEFRLGDTYADVTPSSVVPEPFTYAMAAMGLLGLGLYGWRRRQVE